MYAVIETGGKQYKVGKGDVIEVEKLDGDASSRIVFDRVLLVADEGGDVKVGNPYLKGVKVEAVIVEQKKDRKVIVFKMKRRKNYRRKRGHRQRLTVVEIKQIIQEIQEGQDGSQEDRRTG